MKWSHYTIVGLKANLKIEKTLKECKDCIWKQSSNEWLTELINEMLVFPDNPPSLEFNNERVSEFLHPEIF